MFGPANCSLAFTRSFLRADKQRENTASPIKVTEQSLKVHAILEWFGIKFSNIFGRGTTSISGSKTRCLARDKCSSSSSSSSSLPRGFNMPLGSNNFFTSRIIAMASGLLEYFKRASDNIISSQTGTAPPTKPVLPPCGHIAKCRLLQYFKISDISCVVPGLKTNLLSPRTPRKKSTL
uniref:Uncharacterized protein n=1 Tax=Glossina brevipalpis TaxID=37001 RepID=A0A1A9X1G7_9MUSC